MPVPTGNMDPEAAVTEVQAAMRFFEDLKSMGLRILNIAEKPAAGRSPEEQEQFVRYLVLYRRVKALPR